MPAFSKDPKVSPWQRLLCHNPMSCHCLRQHHLQAQQTGRRGRNASTRAVRSCLSSTSTTNPAAGSARLTGEPALCSAMPGPHICPSQINRRRSFLNTTSKAEMALHWCHAHAQLSACRKRFTAETHHMICLVQRLYCAVNDREQPVHAVCDGMINVKSRRCVA